MTAQNNIAEHTQRIIEDAIEHGDEESQHRVVRDWWAILVRLVTSRIPSGAGFDGEDVALSVFRTLFAANQGDRNRATPESEAQLWGLLVTIARRKIQKRLKFESRLRRDRGREVQNPAELPARQPHHEVFLEIQDELEQQKLWDVVDLRFQNYSNAEVSKKLGVSLRTVERRLSEARRILQRCARDE